MWLYEGVCYGDDFNPGQLKLHLEVLKANFPSDDSEESTLKSVLKSLSPSQQTLISEVCKVAQLIIVMPASNAVSESCFSILRNIKDYLRTTMTQTRLNSLMTLHIEESCILGELVKKRETESAISIVLVISRNEQHFITHRFSR